MDLNSTLKAYQSKINTAILNLLPPPTTQPTHLHEAIHYSMTAGGKRLRPTLLLMAYELFLPHPFITIKEGNFPTKGIQRLNTEAMSQSLTPVEFLNPLPAAVAIECIHTSSLIHDDLPAMDDSSLRRGLPTCHRQFDEATAILAGDALLILPFHILAQYYSDAEPTLLADLIQTLAHASGSERLMGGQAQDLKAEQSVHATATKHASHHSSFFNENIPSTSIATLDLANESATLETTYLKKTAALISASLYMGLRLVTNNIQPLSTIKRLGEHLGIAFQIIDDILDITSKPETLGKDSRDAALSKLTYPALYGLEASKEKAAFHTEEAIKITKALGGNNEPLLRIIEALLRREC